MRFEFEAVHRGNDTTVRVLPLIEDHRLCRIEGRNGIGKSLALRLLELASGKQPFELEVLAWQSFKDRVQEVTLNITQLRGAERIVWSSNTDKWPDEPMVPDDRWIGQYEIDGRAAQLAEVRELFSASRIVGDETIVQTIAGEMQRDAAHLQEFRERVTLNVNAVTAELGRLRQDLANLEPSRLMKLREMLSPLQQRRRAVAREEQDARRRVAQLCAGLDKAALLEKLDTEAPEFTRAIDELSERIKRCGEERVRVEQEMRAMQLDVADEQKAASEVEAVFGRLQDYEREREEIQAAITGVLAQLDEDADENSVNAQINLRGSIVAELQEKKRRFDKVPALRDLLTDLDGRLNLGLGEGLKDETLYEDGSAGPVSVSALHEKLERRQEELADQPPSEESLSIDGDVARHQLALKNLRELRALYARLKGNETLVKRARTRWSGLRQRLAEGSRDRYNQLAERSEQLQRERDDLVDRRSAIVTQRAAVQKGQRREDLVEDLTHIEAALGSFDRSAWRDRLVDEEQRLTALTADLAQLSDAVQTHERDVKNLENVLVTYAQQFAQQFGWLPGDLRLGAESPEDLAISMEKLDEVRGRIDRVEALLTEVNGAPIAVMNNVERLAQTYRAYAGGTPKVDGLRVGRRHFVDEALRFYQTQFARYFEGGKISEALFDGGVFQQLDLNRLSVSWIDANGVSQSRPLEAFSSGERAFAYTLTRLERQDNDHALNRVVALDEFGAFMAQDRMLRLLDFLKNEVLDNLAEQIIIVLPLSQDYDRLAADSTGRAAVRAADLAMQIRERGYITEDQTGVLA